jgi:hypothetical protein
LRILVFSFATPDIFACRPNDLRYYVNKLKYPENRAINGNFIITQKGERLWIPRRFKAPYKARSRSNYSGLRAKSEAVEIWLQGRCRPKAKDTHYPGKRPASLAMGSSGGRPTIPIPGYGHNPELL